MTGGTYSGEYGTLKIQRKPSRCISFLDFFEVCAPRLSMNRQILTSGLAARTPARYSLNLSTFTDFSKIW